MDPYSYHMQVVHRPFSILSLLLPYAGGSKTLPHPVPTPTIESQRQRHTQAQPGGRTKAEAETEAGTEVKTEA